MIVTRAPGARSTPSKSCSARRCARLRPLKVSTVSSTSIEAVPLQVFGLLLVRHVVLRVESIRKSTPIAHLRYRGFSIAGERRRVS